MQISQVNSNRKVTASAKARKANSPSWRGALPIHPAANKIPSASDVERQDLAGDLAKYGLKVPVVLVCVAGGPPHLLDGRHRLDLLEGAGTRVVGDDGGVLVQHQIVDVADDAEAERLSLSLNAHRRHLTAKDRRKLTAAALEAMPEKSNRQIAATMKVDHKTVASVRAEKEATGEIPQLKTTVGKDGKARKKRTTKAGSKTKTKTEPITTAKMSAVAKPPDKTPANPAGGAEELALLSEFARFVIERATAIRFEPKDHAEYKVLRSRVVAVLP
jgi:hypothetical protein